MANLIGQLTCSPPVEAKYGLVRDAYIVVERNEGQYNTDTEFYSGPWVTRGFDKDRTVVALLSREVRIIGREQQIFSGLVRRLDSSLVLVRYPFSSFEEAEAEIARGLRAYPSVQLLGVFHDPDCNLTVEQCLERLSA